MKADEQPPFDEDVLRDLEAERRAFEGPPDAVRRAIAERLRPMLDAPEAPPAPRTMEAPSVATASAGLVKAGFAFLVGAGVGAAVATSIAPAPEVRYVERVVVREADASVAVPASASSAASATASSTEALKPRPAASEARPVVDSTLAEERSLLETARSALARRDATRALDAIREHERRFANGRMTEEREALAVQALVTAGLDDEAHARAAKFRARYPQGLFLPVVEAAIGSTGDR